jgi:hypothetical protein
MHFSKWRQQIDVRRIGQGTGQFNELPRPISIDQKRRIDSLKAVSSRQNQIRKGKPSSYYNPKNEDKDYNRSSDIIRMLNDKSYGKPENEYASESPKEKTPIAQPDPVKYLRSKCW